MRLMTVIMLALALCSCATTHHAPGEKAGGDTLLVCHKGHKTMEMPREAVDAHLSHGDSIGPCSGS